MEDSSDFYELGVDVASFDFTNHRRRIFQCEQQCKQVHREIENKYEDSKKITTMFADLEFIWNLLTINTHVWNQYLIILSHDQLKRQVIS